MVFNHICLGKCKTWQGEVTVGRKRTVGRDFLCVLEEC